MHGNDRSILGFVTVSHALVHTYELSIPVLLVIWLAEFDAGTATLGAVVALGYALFGIGGLPGGVLVDRFGSRRLVLACLVGMGGAFLLLSVARSVVTIAAALCVWGLAASVYHPAGLSLISTGVRARGTGFAYHGVAGNLGIALGPLATALLLLFLGWRAVAALLVVPAVAAALYATTVDFDETAAVDAPTDARPGSDVDDASPAEGANRGENLDGGERGNLDGDERGDLGGGDRGDLDDEPLTLAGFLADSRSLFTVGFALAFVVVMANGLFYRGTLTFLPDVLGDYLPDVAARLQLFDPDSAVAEAFDPASYLYAGLLTVGVGGQYVGGKLTDRVRTEVGLAATFGALALVAVAFVPAAEAGVATLLVASALLGFCLFALQPLYQATIAEYSPPGERGLSYGYTYLGSFGVGAGGAVLAGYLLEVGGVRTTFLALAAFPVLGAVLSLALFRYGTRRA